MVESFSKNLSKHARLLGSSEYLGKETHENIDLSFAKVLFTDRCRRQNFHPSLLRLVDSYSQDAKD